MIGYDHIKLDFSSKERLKKQISKLNIDHIINCIGYTNVELCEKNKTKSYEINSDIPEIISTVSKELDLKFIHISTDHLFDGKSSKYTENDEEFPINIYSKSKLDGEKKILFNNSKSLIIRTNFFGFGPSYKNSFSDFILNNIENKSKIKLFSDVYYSPIIL